MNIYSFSLGLLGTNCYIIEQNQKALVVDPGGDAEKLIQFFSENDIQPIAILLTHAHFDHIGGVEELRSYYSIDVYMHELEREWLTNPQLNGSQRFQVGEIKAEREADQFLTEGISTIDQFEFKVLHTPGHSPGSISFLFESNNVLIAGDTLFQMGIGRTDLPFGEHQTLLQSIQGKIFNLSDDTTVLPGHGPKTTVGEEKEQNPFF
ncbi:glyoxylase-like metal-dependent hydrolase (beta-lactamase superfamily II) [Alkalibacillus filiformis]|uniref:Glyoxylase-like metal-dependent hydrolase (Beta-lactamase superfamily II) n=1 Tax=Alkalibacillus filiformis TaxID=200990 RepID=A0ABU0DRF1_9BACI|nr:MBL fold metallo-hydrolase [Alkalibacillus filiformis]MDQ0351015.1 glyoxylase-like metal-dependent hydrolase (beta-lactamase superfamily II) [Alkalibacillus filiformis]